MMLSNNMLRPLSVALALGLSFNAAAQDAGAATDLDGLVVTGTRTAVTADQSLAAVEVIDRRQIERSQAHSLQDLLRGRAGIDLANQGGLGKVSTLFMRGTESDHTLFLIDGVRVGSATSGLTALQDLPLELIERIEIVRGPRSSLYGSEAIGGVIQVFTRGRRDGIRTRLHAGGGSHGLREAGAGIGLGGAHGWLGIDASHQSDEGINACRGSATPVFAGCGMDNPDPDRDGYRNNAVSLRGGLDLGTAWKADVHAMRADAHSEYDGDPIWGLPDNSDTIQQVVGGRIRYSGQRVALQFSAGRNTDSSDNYRGAAPTDRFATHRDSAGLQADFTLAAGQLLTVGTDWSRDSGGVIGGFNAFEASRDNKAGFAQYQGTLDTGRFGKHDLQLSARHDDNELFGGHDTGSAAWGMDIAHGLRLTASYGTAFKAPSFNELYFPFYGNPDLRPETSGSAEIGVTRRNERWHWRLNAYQTTVDDLIVYDPTIFIANNIESARIRGAELGAGTTLAGWDVNAQATLMDPRNLSAFSHDKLLPRRSRRSARIDADRAVGAWKLGASVIAQGTRFDDVQNAIPMGGYATLDLRAERSLGDWTVQAGVRNAFDRFYETAAFFNQPGREYSLMLRYAP